MNDRDRDKRVRTWSLTLILAPALFFVAYWFYIQQGEVQKTPPPSNPLPEAYVPAGTTVTLNGNSIKAGVAGKNFYSKTLNLKHNRVMAESGKTFLIIPVFASQQIDDPSWTLLDSSGDSFRPLPVNQRAASEALGTTTLDEPERTTSVRFLVFKVPENSSEFYLKLQIGDKTSAWRFSGPG